MAAGSPVQTLYSSGSKSSELVTFCCPLFSPARLQSVFPHVYSDSLPAPRLLNHLLNCPLSLLISLHLSQTDREFLFLLMRALIASCGPGAFVLSYHHVRELPPEEAAPSTDSIGTHVASKALLSPRKTVQFGSFSD